MKKRWHVWNESGFAGVVSAPTVEQALVVAERKFPYSSDLRVYLKKGVEATRG